MPVLFYAFQASAQTWLPAGGGDWTVGANWSGGSAPIPGASVVINSDQSGNITNIPTINLSNLTITGSCVFAAASSGNTVIVTGNFTVAAGETFTIGAAGARMNFTLTATAIGTISGTAILDSFVGGTDRFFINNGDLSIPVGGLLSGVGESIFSTTSGSTLRIGSPAGITLSGATGSVQTTGTPSSRIYDTGANYVYIGNANQGVGNGLPATVASLTIANTGGGGNNTVTLASNISITNSLSVNSGVFALGTNNVTSVGSVSMTGTSIAGTGTLTLAGNVSTNSSTTTATISAPIALNAIRTLTIANGAANPDLTISSIISTTGGLVKNGAGLLFLSASNSFTGGVSIDAGTLRLGNAGALNSGTPNVVAFGAGSTGILQLNGNSVTVSDINTNIAVGTPVIENGVAGTSTLTINTSGSSTYAGTIQNGGAGITAITKSGTGSLTLSGGNTHTGTTTLSAGTLSINSATAIGTGSLTISGGTIDNTSGGGITLSTNNAQNWNGDFTFTGTQNLNMGTGVVAMSANRLITTNASNLTVGGIISGGFRLTKDGGGTLTLTGANTFSGGTTLNAGTLNINNPNALGTVAGTFIINGGTIDNATGGSITTLNYPQTWAGDFSFTGTQNLNLGTGNVTIGSNRQVTVNANTLTVGGVISAPGVNLTKAGAGTLSFGSNAVTVNSLANNAGILNSTSGTLTIAGNFNSTGTFNHSNGLVIFNGGSPQSLAGVIYNHLNLTGAGQKNASGNVSVVGNLTNASVFDLSTHTLSVSGTIANTGGTIRFAGPSNGMAINTGTVEYYGAGQNVAAGIYQNLTISQSSGEASLGGAVTVNGVLTLNTGRLNLNGFNLTLGPTATISVASPSASKMIVATGGSEVIKTFNSTGLFDFPIGDNSGTAEYSPVSVNITSGTGFPANVSVSVTDGKHPNNASSANFISRYWNVTQTGITNCIATISGVYLDADINGAEASIKGAELTGAFNQVSNPWIKYAAVTAASNTLTCTGVIPNLSSGLTSSFTGITSADPMVSITGGGITICAGNSVALNAPVVGGDPTILYSWTPAAGLSATSIANPTASPTVTTVYTVNIYDGNGITATSNTTITVDQTAPSAIAGADQNLCNTSSFTLAGNAAAPGTGAWTIQSGTGTVTTPSSPTSTITGVTATTVVRWTISNGVCGSTFDEVSLTNEATPSTADAGVALIDQCNTSTFTMNATVPLVGIGVWTVQSGSAVITNNTSATTTITGVAAGTSATLRWTVGNGTCPTTFDDIILTNTAPAPVAGAGPDQNLCNTSSFTLAGNAAAPGTGAWTIQSGTGTVTTPSSPTSTITGVTATTVVRWTISNGVCGSTFDEVSLTNEATPSTADAGVALIDQCNTSTFTMNATVPLVGIGVWTVQSGSAVITNNTSATTTITGVAAGTSATLRWTVGNGTCPTTFDDIVLTNTAPAPVAIAGADQNLCNTSSFTLAGNAAAPGTGAWTIQSGTGTVTTPSSPTSTITGVTATTVVRWTISNGVCGSTFDEVSLTNEATPSTADAGVALIDQCNTSTFTMNATVPLVGIGVWTVQSGSAVITNNTSATTTITGVAAGTSATLRWTVGNGTCPTTFDDIILTNTAPAPVASAGADQNLCNTSSFTLAGNAAAPGTGAWTIQSGTGTVTTPSSPTSTITGVTATTVVRWTISNGVCGSTFDEVSLTNEATPSTADAGVALIDQCNTSTFTMNATVPLVGSGVWTVQSGSAVITNNTSATTTITGVAAGTSATLRWTVGNGTCPTTFDDIILTNTAPAPVASAGADQNLCNTSSFTLAGNAAAPGTGAWTIQSGTGTVTTPSSPTSTITGVTATTVVRWTISNGVCGSTFDEVSLTNEATPSTADAGVALIDQCNTSTFTMNATVPLVGSGVWTVQSGSAVITNNTSATTTITGVAAGTSATLRWTVGNGTCPTTFDDIILTNTAPAPVASAGADQNLCNTSSFTLAGNAAAPGTGAWTIQSGTGTVTTPSSPTSTITGVTATTVVRWTISNGVCGSTFDEVSLTNEATPSTADAGVALIDQCNTSTFTMNATVPLVGSGVWTVQSGSAVITNNTSATTTITGVAAGTSATLRWTVGNGTCPTTFDDIILTNTAPAPVASAGADQNLCNTSSFTLAGNAAAPGTGAWTIQSGTGTVTTPSSPTSTITGVTATTVVRWTISNGVCGSTFDEVSLTNEATPSTADAGVALIDQCNTSTFTMNATVPLVGSGVWTVQSGSAVITNNTSATTTITGVAAGTSATLRWTVGNGTCPTTFDDIILTNTAPAPVASAGADQNLCNTSSFTLAGNAAAPGTGAWTIQSGTGTVTTPSSPTSTITGVTATTVVRWTISNGVCGSTFDEVSLTNEATPSTADAGVALIDQCNTSTFTMNATVPLVGSGVWTVQSGSAVITNNTSATTTITGVAAGTSATLRWTVGNGTCPTTFDDIILTNTAPAPVAGAGPDQNLCNTSSFTLAGNAAAPGTGAWTIQSGTGTVTTPSSPTSTITGVTATTVVRWTISNGVCGSTFDEVSLTNEATPSTADAGVALIDQCNTSTFTMNATVPLVGSGVWTVQSGSAVITNNTSATTTITGVAAGTSATLRWTVGNGTCPTTFDDIILTNTAPAPVASAGADQNLCNTSSFTLAGNAAAPGTGAWTIQSGTGTVTTPSSPTSTITGVTATTVVRWTISNGVCGSTFDEVSLTNEATPSTADAGVALIDQCNTSTFTMNATVPLVGSGVWTVQSGSAVITNNTSATTTITGVAAGTSATLRWTVGNGTCPTTFDDIILTNTAPAPVASAGADQNLCNTSSFTLAGNAAAPGTGAWTIQSGTGTVTTPSSPTSTITGVTATTVVRWTISNGVCGSTFDEVSLTNEATPSTADAGVALIDQCNTSTFTMNATVPLVGSGVWTVQSGSAVITNNTSATTTITGVAAGTSATLRWTVGNGTCPTTFDDIILTNTAPAPVASAGADQNLCNTSSFTLAGNAAAPGTGAWTIQSGTGTVTTPSSPTSTITGVTATTVVRWTISNGVCGSTFDEVSLTNEATPSTADAGVALIDQCNTSTFTMNATVPLVGSGVWTVQSGSAVITNNTSATTTITGVAAGTSATLRWTVGNGTCPTTFDDIILTNTAPAPVASAGADQNLCNTSSFTLAGNAAAPGTGAWTIQSGTGTVTTPSSPTSTITGVTATTVVRWTISNGVCGSTFDEVSLTNEATPSTADAGVALIDQCNTSTFTMNATVPLVGSGVWTVQSGSAVITNNTSATTTITGVAAGTSATLRWTVGNGTCPTTFDDIILTNTAPAPVASAGADQNLCNTSSFTLAGNAAAPGTGAWTIQSGTGTVTTPSSPTSTITGVTATTVVRWTISNGVCGSTFDEVSLTNEATPSTADAGVALIDQCNTSTFTMNATVPLVGSGVWTVQSGSAVITNNTSATTTITGVAAGTSATLRWTVGNGTCPTTFDDIILTNTAPAPVASAGADQNLCNTSSFTLAGNAAAPGTGAWTIQSGTGTVTTPSSPTSTITGVTATTVVRWTISNGVCGSTFDEVSLTNEATPSTADAGVALIDQCNTSTFTMNATVPLVGSGVWTVQSGSAVITNNTSATTTITGVAAGTSATLRWTVGNGTCPTTFDDIILTNTAPAPVAGAGPDQNLCNTSSFTLAGNAAAPGTGAWTIQSGTGTVTTPSSPTSTITGVTATTVVRWTISNGVCGSTFDEVSLTNEPVPVVDAGSNAETCQGINYNFSTQSTPASASNYGTISWAHTGTGVLFNANTFTPTYQPGVGETGVINFTLTATSVGGTCSSVNDVMTLTITPAVALNAGTDVETCEGVAEDLSLRGGGVATAVNYSTLSWTGGTGSFSDATILNPVYTPGVGETGAVTLTITANGNGSCATVTDQIVINVTPAVIVNAGSDDETCEGVSFDFGTRTTVATASNYSSVSWSGGAGTIFNGLTLNPTYFPGPGETGIVTFTLTAFGNGSCVAQVSTMDLLITPAPIANAGNDDAVCEGTATFNFNARAVVASSLNGTVSWTHNGMGSLNDNTLLNPVYTVGAGDVGNTVTFTLMVTSPSAVCSVVLDQFTLDVNQAPIVIIPSPSITVCEPAQIQLSGFVSGAATDASWSIVSAGGSLSVSSKILSEIRATYDTVTSDVNSTLIFRLTSNDPDGVGPCIPAAADLSVIVNESAKVFAGADFEVCEYDDIDLNGSFSGSTSSVIWSGGSGAPQFGNVTSPITSYDMTPAERAATGLVLTFTLTTDDPVGVCPSTFDQVKVTVNDTTFASFSGLELIYQEDDPIDALVGFPPGGTFTGPGIISGTSDFNPDFANIGTNVIVYSYQDPSTGCFSNPQQTTIVNPITTILWSAKLYNSSTSLYDITAPDNAGVQEICATIRPGDVQLKGTPDVLDPMASVVTPPYFTISPDVSPSYIFQKLDGQYYINTKAMPPATYIVTYVYTNNFEAQTQLSKPINVLSAPMARIDVGNSCVSSLINFTESSFIPVNNGANLQKWTWAFGNGIGSSDPEPQYQYPVAGTYNVTLEVETDEGCKHDTLRVVRVGPVPKMNFTWSEFCNGNDTKFVDGTFVGGSTIIQYTWEFADGFSVTGPAGAPIPGGTNGGRTGGTYTNPNHRYDTFGQYNVKLTVSTDDGCVNDTTRRAFILSYGTPSPTAGYIEDFESGPGTWVGTRTDISIPTDTSWVFGSPSGAVINSASSGINAWWTGGNPNTAGLKSTYYPAEKSAVIGPCVNLTNIKRPMLSLDYWSDAEDGRDGAVVQFSVDGGISWQAIGNDAGAGLNWYDGRALPGNPGLQPIGQFGWSKSDYQTGGWKTARYNLDQIPKADRNEVIFRVAYGSNNDNQFNDPNRTVEYNGFAFDNIFIGEKQRNVLVEYFTNAGVNPTANDYLNNLYLDQRNVLNKDSSDFFKIQYHIANPSADVINQDNPVDPAARSLYYGVSQPPVGIMDGILGNYYGTNFNGDQTKINAVEVDRRALEDPLFDILVTENTTTADSINLNVEFEYRAAQVHTTPVTFYVGLVDSLVSGNVHVLRKMLLGSEGMTVSTTWNTGDSTIIPVKSIIDVPIGTANSNLWIVAFVQDRNTKRIHQTAFVKAGAPKDEAVVVGLDDPVLNGAKSIQIYPNPASHQLNFASEYRLMEGYTYSIVDQRGVTVLEGELKEDIFNPQQVELDKVTNGIYFVIISRGGRALVHRKIAVLNRN